VDSLFSFKKLLYEVKLMETIWSSGNRISWCLPVSGTVAHRKKSRTIPTMNVRR